MSHNLSILMAQINPTVGAIERNTAKILDIIASNQNTHDLIVFPELALTGYPPEDLLLRQELMVRVEHAIAQIKDATLDCHVIVGHPTVHDMQCYNSASIIYQHQINHCYHKQHLPNYGVFDEQRYFQPGPRKTCVFSIQGHRFGLCICEDIWREGPVEDLAAKHIDTLLVLNASPFDIDKPSLRLNLLKHHAQKGMSIIYVNQVGGQDELVFDGQSLALDNKGRLCAQSNAFVETLDCVTLTNETLNGSVAPKLDVTASIYQALCCGLRDYMKKNHATGVLLGLSGGIDSALTLAVAVDTLGADNVHAVLMPSRHTQQMSIDDALAQARSLKVKTSTLSIEPAFTTLLQTLEPSFNDKPKDVTEENLQARIRGVLLMALSNKHGKLVLSTSNKSETAVGFATLYGDMCGGFSVLKDVLKTQVYELARYRNTLSPIIPERVLTRAPSAELAPNQTDQDRLPEYAIMDAIIMHYMQNKLSSKEIIALGFSPDDVTCVIDLIKRNEYKRRQAAMGVKISPCAFGRDWRYPVTSGF